MGGSRGDVKWKACDVGEAKEGLENELWRRWSNGRVGEWAVSVGKATEELENELWRRWSDGEMSSAHSPTFLRRFTHVTAHSPTLPSLYLRHSSFFNPSVALPSSQLILQPFFRFFYGTGSSLTSPGESLMRLYHFLIVISSYVSTFLACDT